jgi:hypothetical protein
VAAGGEEYANVEASTRRARWPGGKPEPIDPDELCRLAAKQMLATALLAERQAYLDAHADLVDQTGKRLVVGNGYAKPREVMTGAGHGGGKSSPGGRPPTRQAFPLGRPAHLHAQVAQGDRSAGLTTAQ